MTEDRRTGSRMTYGDLLARLLVHRPWIDAQGIPTGQGSRFAGLIDAIEFVDEAYRTGLVSKLMDDRTKLESIWSLVEASELEAALSRLRPLSPKGLANVVRTALTGENAASRIPTTPDLEGESAVNRARNDVFQLVIGAHLSRIDDKMAFDEPDVVAQIGARKGFVACKRPFGASGVRGVSQRGAEQVAGCLPDSKFIGLLAVAAGRLVPLDPGKPYIVARTEIDVLRRLDRTLLTEAVPAVHASLTEMRDRAINIVVVQASVPAVVGDLGLNRVSHTIVVHRAEVGILDRYLLARIKSCFETM